MYLCQGNLWNSSALNLELLSKELGVMLLEQKFKADIYNTSLK